VFWGKRTDLVRYANVDCNIGTLSSTADWSNAIKRLVHRAISVSVALLSLLAMTNSLAAIPASERAALIALYDATGGANWTTKTNWNGPAGTECTWYGISCSPGNDNVIGISLAANNLVGPVPNILNVAFPKLEILLINSNKLTGTLPALSGLTSLRDFEANANQFTGSLPSLAGLIALRRVWINTNQLDGTLSPLAGLSALESFDAQDNQLTGTIPSLDGLTALIGLNLADNKLTGSIPPLSGRGLTALRSFSVWGNQLTGTIPALTGLAELGGFNVRNNQLTGSMPDLTGLSKLTSFHIENNQLTGAIKPVPSPTNALLAEGSALCPNQFTASVDAAWDAATPGATWNIGCVSFPSSERAALIALYEATGGANWTTKTNWNGPAGTECTWFGISCDTGNNNVTQIYLPSNNLVGSLPSNLISSFSKIEILVVSYNKLTGSIPSLGASSTLRDFYAAENQLDGPIPPLSGLTALRDFDVNTNRLTGSIPALSGLSLLREFRVYNNRLDGSIPALTGLTNLRAFVASGNRLEGSIPALSGLTSLDSFQVTANRLTGSIPALTGLTKLQAFVASGNRLEGSIPALSGLTSLDSFLVTANRLTGSIPALTGLTNLRVFSAARNQLSGPIPSLSGLANLEEFLVFDNQLTGGMPDLAGLSKLEHFRIQNNRLSGAITPVPSPTNALKAELSALCPNQFTPSVNAAWDAATPGATWDIGCSVVAPSAPGTPSAVSATAGNGQIAVAFVAPLSTGGAPIIDYTVSCSPNGSATATSSPVIVTGLLNGTAYSCTVTARNLAGSSAPSPPVAARPQAPEAAGSVAVPTLGAFGALALALAVIGVGLTANRANRR
jgi:Leucine-rich repeat (LRR) protein